MGCVWVLGSALGEAWGSVHPDRPFWHTRESCKDAGLCAVLQGWFADLHLFGAHHALAVGAM